MAYLISGLKRGEPIRERGSIETGGGGRGAYFKPYGLEKQFQTYFTLIIKIECTPLPSLGASVA